MRSTLMAFMLLLSTSAMALDPFSVYQMQAPKGCLTDEKLDLSKRTDLPTLIQVAICNNPALSRDYMSVKASEAEFGATKGAYLPTITASGKASKSTTKYQGEEKKETTSPYSGNVGISWLLYDFGKRGATTDQMLSYLTSDSFTYSASLHDLLLSVNQAYFDLLSNQEVLKSAKESMKSYKKSYEETSKRYQLGMISLSDKLLAQTTYEKSELAVLEAENAIAKSGAVLASLLNLPTDTHFNLELPPRDKDITLLNTDMTVQQMMDKALEMRPELKSAQSQQDAARFGIDIAKAGHYPTISATAEADYNNVWSGTKSYRTTASGGIGLSVPLFNGFSTSYGVDKARYQYEKSVATVAEKIDLVKKEVYNAYQDYKTAVSSYRVNQKVLESAKESERVAFKSYQAGKESILNLLTAQAQLAAARQSLAVSFYTVLTSKATLYRAIGQF